MNKSEFFSFLEENQSEIIMVNSRVKTIQRGSVVEVTLCVPGYASFTLSRHKPNSQKLELAEAKFARWFAEWSEIEPEEVKALEVASKDMVISSVEVTSQLFDHVEFVSMRPIVNHGMKKKPEVNPAKVTQQKKDKEYPQTSSQHLNAWRSVVASQNYHLPHANSMINLSEIITCVFRRRRNVITPCDMSRRKSSAFPSVMARTDHAPPKVRVGLLRRFQDSSG